MGIFCVSGSRLGPHIIQATDLLRGIEAARHVWCGLLSKVLRFTEYILGISAYRDPRIKGPYQGPLLGGP